MRTILVLVSLVTIGCASSPSLAPAGPRVQDRTVSKSPDNGFAACALSLEGVRVCGHVYQPETSR